MLRYLSRRVTQAGLCNVYLQVATKIKMPRVRGYTYARGNEARLVQTFVPKRMSKYWNAIVSLLEERSALNGPVSDFCRGTRRDDDDDDDDVKTKARVTPRDRSMGQDLRGRLPAATETFT